MVLLEYLNEYINTPEQRRAFFSKMMKKVMKSRGMLGDKIKKTGDNEVQLKLRKSGAIVQLGAPI